MATLYGVACAQVRLYSDLLGTQRADAGFQMYNYFTEYTKDALWLKSLVVIMWYVPSHVNHAPLVIHKHDFARAGCLTPSTLQQVRALPCVPPPVLKRESSVRVRILLSCKQAVDGSGMLTQLTPHRYLARSTH